MPESILPDYTFLPWLRKGIANKIEEVDTKGIADAVLERAKVDVTLNILASNGDESIDVPINKEVKLIGPGDIVGINATAIVKNDPKDKTHNFEPNYLASIQFYDEDFAWRYSPAKANTNGQLRPWLFLFVLKESEFEFEDPTFGILPSIKIPTGADASFLPKYQEIGTWAHVHVNDKLGDTIEDSIEIAIDKLELNNEENPNLATCRILSPRKLASNTTYHAFLVPSFETGRLAGLGVKFEEFDPKIPSQLASWGTSHNPDHEPNRWPVYHSWSFETSEGGDFEQLVRLLKPRSLDNQVGRRPMDLQEVGVGLSYGFDIVEGEETVTKTTLSLEGALKIPASEGEAYPYPENLGIDFRKKLQDLVNLDEDLKENGDLGMSDNFLGELGAEIGGTSVNDDPIISPPLYGRWHILERRADKDNVEGVGATANWFHELNLDPRNRAVAAIGTAVVQKEQESLMDDAWGQLGDVIEANKKIIWTQLATETSNALFKKHIKSQPNEKTLAITGRMKRRLTNDLTGKTYYQEEKESQLPLAVEDKSFRRIVRPFGPILKKIDPAQLINKSEPGLGHEMVKRLDQNLATAAIEKTAPDIDSLLPLIPMDAGITSGTGIGLYNFNLTAPGDGAVFTAMTTAEANAFKIALGDFADYFSATNWTEPAVKPEFNIAKAIDIKEKIEPKKTLLSRVYKTIVFDTPGVPPTRIVPAMAHPVFRKPMYEAIRDLDSQLLIPNLNLVPMNTISLLETNQKFIESYMVGLNHEMGRELLWREYPTDQRGTYFQQFWNVTDSINTEALSSADFETARYDISKIHTWTKTSKLGTHNTTEELAKPVLLIRGDLLKKYPNAIIYAIKAEWQLDEVTELPNFSLPRRPKADTEVYPIFNAKIEPDITFFGFDLTIEEARGDDPALLQRAVAEAIRADEDITGIDGEAGYFFVLKERPGEARFALDSDPGEVADFETWNDLHWGRLTSTETIGLGDLVGTPDETESIVWGENMNAAQMASVLYQNPVMVCVHAREMLEATE